MRKYPCSPHQGPHELAAICNMSSKLVFRFHFPSYAQLKTTYPVFDTVMLLAPTDQFNGMESSGTATTGGAVPVNTARIRKEISVNTQGSLYRARVVDFSHYVGLVFNRICRSHCVQVIAINTSRRSAAILRQRASSMVDLADVTTCHIRIAVFIKNSRGG